MPEPILLCREMHRRMLALLEGFWSLPGSPEACPWKQGPSSVFPFEVQGPRQKCFDETAPTGHLPTFAGHFIP